MHNIFTVAHFEFPYLYKFPGQATDERILYVTREHEVIYRLRQFTVIFTSVVIFFAGYMFSKLLGSFIGNGLSTGIEVFAALSAVIFLGVGFWWIRQLWRKSIAVVTNKRLIKFIHTTPWNRHNLSLPLDMIVDTGAYSKGWLQAVFKLGTFTARSSAASSGVATDDPDRVNKKYFYIENLGNAEDLHNYLHKILFVFRQDWTKLENFRPFLPGLKGEKRKEFMKQYPEYWS